MPQLNQFGQTYTDIILQLLKDSELGQTFFKNYYYGIFRPDQIPNSSLPCVSVGLARTTIGQRPGPTGMDEAEHRLTLQVFINIKDDLGADNNEMAGARRLEQYVEGIDPTTNELDDRSVAGILRKNFTLNNSTVDQSMEINYDYWDKNDQTATIGMATINFSATNLRSVSGRV